MDALSAASAALSSAFLAGQNLAVAFECREDLRACADRHPLLFTSKPFDDVLMPVSLANAFGSPGATADELKIATRTSLAAFAVDFQIDHLAETGDQVHKIVRDCLACADGGASADEASPAPFLAEIHDLLAASPAFAPLRAAWHEELERWLRAMEREWMWKAGRTSGGEVGLPNLEQYVDNADNFTSCWVNLSHWIHTGEAESLSWVEALMPASRAVQRVLRLFNDLATYDRDLRWGDLNVLMLGVGRPEVQEKIASLEQEALRLIESLRGVYPRQAVYLERQLGYSKGFYGAGADYWGELPV
jgi:Terpene synthase family 2, C-terminal metal binding